MNWETYAAFGDSITKGARTYLGYPEIAGDILSQHLSKEWNVINHSTNGYKAIDLARWIDQSYAHLAEQKPSISSILIGTNDIKEGTTLRDFLIALRLILLKVKLLTPHQNVFILKVPVFPEGVMYPYTIKMNDQIHLMNNAIEDLATINQIRCLTIDLHIEHFQDGIHLNDVGLQTFGKQIAAFILDERGIKITHE